MVMSPTGPGINKLLARTSSSLPDLTQNGGETEKYGHVSWGAQTKNDWPGKGQQQFTRKTDRQVSQS
jgi:hypothetical protein